MPLKHVEPDLFVEHKGVKVYHTYNGEDYNDPSDFWYTTDIHEEPENNFDIRKLPGYSPDIDHYEESGDIIRAAIDAGILKAPEDS